MRVVAYCAKFLFVLLIVLSPYSGCVLLLIVLYPCFWLLVGAYCIKLLFGLHVIRNHCSGCLLFLIALSPALGCLLFIVLNPVSGYLLFIVLNPVSGYLLFIVLNPVSGYLLLVVLSPYSGCLLLHIVSNVCSGCLFCLLYEVPFMFACYTKSLFWLIVIPCCMKSLSIFSQEHYVPL